jgi:thioredoxin 1
MTLNVTEATFEQEVLKSDTPVIVDFWAEWCGPCHRVSPILDKIVEERSGEVTLVKVNIDEEQGLAQRYGVMSIPTMILFKEGAPAAAAVGALPKAALERTLGLAAQAAA